MLVIPEVWELMQRQLSKAGYAPAALADAETERSAAGNMCLDQDAGLTAC